jgi:hypothetical protein
MPIMDAATGACAEADLALGPFAVWVHDRQYPEAQDEWDGNWLDVTARCAVAGAIVSVRNDVLDTVSSFMFLRELESLNATASGEATLASLEPEVRLTIAACDRAGHLKCRVEITPVFHSQGHWFEFESDLSYLPPVISQCKSILERFPVRNASARGV